MKNNVGFSPCVDPGPWRRLIQSFPNLLILFLKTLHSAFLSIPNRELHSNKLRTDNPTGGYFFREALQVRSVTGHDFSRAVSAAYSAGL